MKKTLFLSAILGAALCSSAFGETTYNSVTYSGHILNIATTDSATFHDRNFSDFYQNGEGTWVNGKEFGGAQKTYYYGADTTGTTVGTDTWNYFFGAGNGKYSTLRLTGATKDIYLDAQFTPLTLGGLIVEAGDHTYTIGRKSGDCAVTIQAENGQQANMTIGANTRISAGTNASADKGHIAIESAGTWDIAQGKSLTLAHFDNNNNETAAAGGIRVNAAVTLTGSGTLKLNGASLTFGANGSITVGANNTLALTTGTDWTMVGEETPRTSGNGFGTATYTRDFGTSIVNNGTITVDGSAATMTDGVVTGTGNSTTYYVHEGAYISSLPGATKLVVNSTSGGDNRLGLSNTTYGNLDIVINGGRVITARNGGTGFTKGDVTVNAGGTLAVVESGGNALGWGEDATKSINLLGDETSKATFELSFTNTNYSLTLATDLNLNGHAQVTGSRSFNTYGGTITATGTDNIISAEMRLRTAASIVVNSGAELLISGTVSSASNTDGTYSMTKTGAGVLTISGNISGTTAHIASITGDGANTVISSGTISNATLNSVKLAKGSAQTINGTVTLNSATLTNELDIYSGGSLTLTGGATTTQTSGFAMIVGKDGHTGTLTFDSGTYDLSKPGDGIAIYSGSSMTVKNGATLTVKKICYSSYYSDKNGNVTVEKGGALNITNGGSYVNSLTSNGAVTVNGDINAEDFLKSNAASGYTQTAGTATMKKYLGLDASAGVTLSDTGKMVVEGTATDTGNGIWMGAKSTITMGSNSTLEVKPVGLTFKNGTITNTSTTNERQVGTNDYQDSYRGEITISADTTVNSGQTVVSGYTFSGGSVTVNSGTETTIKSALSGSTALTVNSGSVATFSGDASVASVAGAGSLNLSHNLTVAGDATIGSLTLSNGADITAETLSGQHNGTITLTGLTVTSTGSEMNGNLVMAGGKLIFANDTTLTMGCSVTIGAGDTVTVELTDDMVSTIANGGHVDLFTDVENATLVNGNIVFTGVDGATLDKANVYSLQYDATTKTIYVTPEPATATLSLLALAALASRRRRH